MAQFNPDIFKAYDIRGEYPNELDDRTGYLIGNALAVYLKPRSIAVGRDMRVSSPALFEALSRGIMDAGVDVIDLGMVSTDGLYFAVGKYGYDAGVMITASHNPKQYNGFKVCKTDAVPLSGSEGLNVIRDMVEVNDPKIRPQRGAIARKVINSAYTENCLSFIDVDSIKEFKVVFDAGNGMAGVTLPHVLEKLPIKSIPLFFDLDGTFPNHPASPIELENLEDLIKKVKDTNADFGVAFDGDADRMFLVDAKGNQVGGDMTTAMVAKSLLEKLSSDKQSHETIIYNAICSRAVPELIEKHGAKAVRTPVGHALIKPTMRKHKAIFGGEHSGHFYFRENWYADSGMIAFLVCLELLSKDDRPLHDIISALDSYVRSGEINSKVDDRKGKIEEISKRYNDGRQDRLDGLTVNYDNWWFNVRASNTEPLLRLNVEADTRETMEAKRDEILKLIRS